mgnify:CR=1 FL=1
MDSAGVDRVIAVARGCVPNIPIIARAKDEPHAERLYLEGVSEAVPEPATPDRPPTEGADPRDPLAAPADPADPDPPDPANGEPPLLER